MNCYIVDNQGHVVRLNDREKTLCQFNLVTEKDKADRICDQLNAYTPRSDRWPYQVIVIEGEL